jgi:GNAT superfamily N-acetyltransferase
MRLSARVATTEDLPAVVQLLADGSATVAGERGGAVFVNRETLGPPVLEQLSGLLTDPAVLVAVGAIDDVAMGSALVRLERLRDGTVLARLEHLWVEPGAREVGLGGELIDLVTKWANEAGATRLDAYALPGNREAKNFLETAGFSARLIVMHRRLGDPNH